MARAKMAEFELKVQPRENLNSVPAEIFLTLVRIRLGLFFDFL